ncbi:hypothetical protein [Nostoc sp.]
MELKEGYIKDFISEIAVRATPEEIEAVQVFLRNAADHDDYGKELIKHVPNGKGLFPIPRKNILSLYFQGNMTQKIILKLLLNASEKLEKMVGTRLENYMLFSRARIGVWFNGKRKLFLKKNESKGKVTFPEIPNIPKHGGKN